MSRRTTDYIIIHCADTYPDMDIGKVEIDRWHRTRGFFCIGYHFVIRRSGVVERGRDSSVAGAHARGYNHKSVGVCMVGGKSRKDNGPEDNFTDKQWVALKSLVGTLLKQYPDAEVIGHRDVSAKACPSFDAKAWFARTFNSPIIKTDRCPKCGQPWPSNPDKKEK